MLAKRIIPCLDVRDGTTVKGVNFLGLRNVGDPVELGRKYAADGADELVFLDISATLEGRNTFAELVGRIADEIDIPFTVGGGISSVEDAGRLLYAGADKVTVNSAAVRDPSLIDRIAAKYGSQFIVVAIDAKTVCAEGVGGRCCEDAVAGNYAGRDEGGRAAQGVGGEGDEAGNYAGRGDGAVMAESYAGRGDEAWAARGFGDGDEADARWVVTTHGGTRLTGRELFSWAKEAADRGAGEILFTSMDHDGTKRGYPCSVYARLTATLPIPVIASGGAGSIQDIADVLTLGNADAALAAGIFHYGEIAIPELKRGLRDRGIPVRI